MRMGWRMGRCRLLLALLLLPFLMGAGVQTGGYVRTGGYVQIGTTASAGSFIALDDSDISAVDLPTAYEIAAVDTSGWAIYDVTCEEGDGGCSPAAGTSRFPSSWGCTALNSAGTADNATNYRCLQMQSSGQYLLYFKNGTYDFRTSPDGEDVFRPASPLHERGIVCQSHSAIINVHTADIDLNSTSFTEENVNFWEGEQEGGGVGEVYVTGSSEVTWGGGSRGDTVILLSDTSQFSTTPDAAGNWVHLQAQPAGAQDAAERDYYTHVTAINPNVSITIAHPLPEDFSSTSAFVRPWNPALDYVMRDCTIQVANPGHTSGVNFMVIAKNMARWEITGNRFVGAYRQYIGSEFSSDGLIANNDFVDFHWDKATNGYGAVFARSSRIEFRNNEMEAITGIAFGSSGQEIWARFNYFKAPDGSTGGSYDAGCNNSFGDGGGNDCDIATNQATHAALHGITFTCPDNFDTGSPVQTSGSPDGVCDRRSQSGFEESGIYFHCENLSPDENDLLGNSGDPSCRGSEPNVVYSCVEWHDAASSNTLFERNLCDGPIWFDGTFGAGRYNTIFGNWIRSGASSFDTSPGGPGTFAHRPDGGSLPAGYRNNARWINNVFDDTFGAIEGYNPRGDGIIVTDNLFRNATTPCIDTDASQPGADGGICSVTSGFDTGTNTTWSDNTVGDTHASPRMMPSSLGGTDWPDWGLTPTGAAPFVGPEMGDPDSLTVCLPAMQRNGGC